MPHLPGVVFGVFVLAELRNSWFVLYSVVVFATSPRATDALSASLLHDFSEVSKYAKATSIAGCSQSQRERRERERERERETERERERDRQGDGQTDRWMHKFIHIGIKSYACTF